MTRHPQLAPPRRARRVLLALLGALCLILGLSTAPAAQAEVLHPRQQWYRDATAGLFLHWGIRTAPGFTDCGEWESAVTNGGWDADYWPREAAKLHASYLVLTSFHSRLGYVRAWPSKIPGSCSTKRDFLGETIAAAKARGMKVLLYMTDDPQWHDQGGHEWLDSAGYSAYKGQDIDLTTRDGFGQYSYDNFVEVMQNYPDLAGFWIDNDNAYWETHGLYERIRQERPDWMLSNNNEDTPIMDTVSNEQKTGMIPAYDYPAATFTPQPRLTEADYKLPSKGNWWFDGGNSSVDTALNLGRYVSNAGASIKSLMAETAQVNGRFPTNQENFNNFAASYLDQIWPSIGGTAGGGYMSGGLQPGTWNDGAFGTTTVSKSDPDQSYVHVLTKPTSATSIKVRDNGYQVTQVNDLRTGEALDFSQAKGFLTIKGITDWDQFDTVFSVRTEGRKGLVPSDSVTASASQSAQGHDPASLTDSDYQTYWDNDTTVPVSVTLDLGRPKKAAYLGVNQREWSVSYARSATEDSARIKDYQVFGSTDDVTWKPIKSGTLESRRGVRFIDLDLQSSVRYLRLQVDSTWAAPTATKFFKKLRIDEMWVGSSYVNTP